ncbi:MAG: hypothetical protein CO128_03990 [Ignavibacteriales bacterium CG_4_9_14_3_um_filter_30_11]|nr:MAG: hypothetical protein CO128_03990 [Ignavibacteriales bacterium CG_4_9_14_3_um_filter_30_11]
MKKLLFTFLLICCNTFSIFALSNHLAQVDSIEQTKVVKKTNLIYGEVGGNGLLLSINYERYLIDNL